MLKARVLTVIVILPLFLLALFYFQDIFWAALLLALTVTGAREWSKLARFSVRNTIIFMFLTLLLGSELLIQLRESLKLDAYSLDFVAIYGISVLFWIMAVPFYLRKSFAVRTPVAWMLVGWVVLLPICLALYQLRIIDPMLLLATMSVVWISDTAAYFTGRSLGKHKLAPEISPNKTWEGVAGAMVAVMLYGLACVIIMEQENLLFALIPMLIVMTTLGIIGDLYESLLKRQAGVKDSGNILPGHGGILDRIDALTSSLPFAILAILIFYSSAL